MALVDFQGVDWSLVLGIEFMEINKEPVTENTVSGIQNPQLPSYLGHLGLNQTKYNLGQKYSEYQVNPLVNGQVPENFQISSDVTANLKYNKRKKNPLF